MNKKWYQSKTVWTNILTIAVGIISAIVSQEGLIPPVVLKWMFVSMGVINVILRAITTTGIEK